MCLQFL
ncbi:hypothetical protein LINPERPRIM_LOCUS36389 [Linum perenne]